MAKESVTKNVAIILGCSIVAKVLSFVWEAILAAYLGTNDQADAFYMTTSVFNILYPVLDYGIWKVFLPLYKTHVVRNDRKGAERFADARNRKLVYIRLTESGREKVREFRQAFTARLTEYLNEDELESLREAMFKSVVLLKKCK